MTTPARTTRDRTRNVKDANKRFDIAVDRILNSGTMVSYMDDFWRYVDGAISWESFNEKMPS